MNWFSEAIRDENGLGDIAYGGLAIVTVAVLGSIFFLGAMELWQLKRCVEIFTVNPPIVCRFSGESFGTAVGYICSGYAASLVALAAYMAATRRQAGSKTTTRVVETDAQSVPPAAREGLGMPPLVDQDRGTPEKPLHVAVKTKPRKRA